MTTGLSRPGVPSPVMTGAPPSKPRETARSWLEREYRVSDEQLGFIRVLYCAFVLFGIGVPSFTWIANSPQLLFDPPLLSAANLLSGWPSYATLWILSASLVILFLLLLFGFFVPTVSVLLSLLLIAGSNLRFSFGKIDHDLLLVLPPLVLARSGWGNRYTLARGPAAPLPNRSGACLGVFAIVVGFAMFTAGFQKLTTGWLDPRTQASYGHLIQNFYGNARGVLLAPFALRVRSKLLWEGFDYMTVAFELLFIVAVMRRWLFRAWIAFAIVFHTGTLLVLDIGFAVNFAAYLVFVEWPLPRRFALARRASWLLAACVSLVVLVVWRQCTGPSQPLSLRMAPSLANYVASRVVGQANINDTTFEIFPAFVALAAARR